MNAILVREMRQAVRSSAVTAIVVMTLLALCAITCVGLMNLPDAVHYHAYAHQPMYMGGKLYFLLLCALTLVGVVCVPLYTGVRMAIECAKESPDLLLFTCLSPHAIVRGKLWCAMGLTFLLVCLFQPFMSICMTMRGIDMRVIAFTMPMVLALVVLATMSMLLVASIRTGYMVKIVMSMTISLFLGRLTMNLLESCESMVVRIGYGFRLPWIGYVSGGNAQMIVVAVAAVIAACGLLYVLSVAMLMPASANRALLVRGYISAMVAVTGLGVVAGTWATRNSEALNAWLWCMTSLIAGSLCMMSGEDALVSYRALSRLKSRGVFRFCASLFCNGPASGILWACAMMVVVLGMGMLASIASGFVLMPRSAFYTIAAYFLYVLGCVMLANVVVVRFLPHTNRKLVPALGVTLVTLLSFAPYGVALALRLKPDELPWTILSLQALFWAVRRGAVDDMFLAMLVGMVFGGSMFAVNVPWLFARMRGYAKEAQPCA